MSCFLVHSHLANTETICDLLIINSEFRGFKIPATAPCSRASTLESYGDGRSKELKECQPMLPSSAIKTQDLLLVFFTHVNPYTTVMKYRIRSHPASQLKFQRSSRACSACRCRKVRCDVALKGPPCTTCQFHDIQCSIPVDRRGEKRLSAESALDKSVSSPANPVRTDHVPIFEGRYRCLLLALLGLDKDMSN